MYLKLENDNKNIFTTYTPNKLASEARLFEIFLACKFNLGNLQQILWLMCVDSWLSSFMSLSLLWKRDIGHIERIYIIEISKNIFPIHVTIKTYQYTTVKKYNLGILI